MTQTQEKPKGNEKKPPTLDRYYTMCILSNNGDGYRYQAIPEVQKWLELEFPELAQKEVLSAEEDRTLQKDLLSLYANPDPDFDLLAIAKRLLNDQYLRLLDFRFLASSLVRLAWNYWNIYLIRPALAHLCLRCYVSESIKGACETMNRYWKPEGGLIELFSYVLDDQGDILFVPYLQKNDQKCYRPFSFEILSIYKSGEGSKSLNSWVYDKIKQNKDLLKVSGKINKSTWNLLNDIEESDYINLGLNPKQIELVKAYHEVCRADRRHEERTRQDIWREPTPGQQARMLEILRQQGININADTLIQALESIAQKYFKYQNDQKIPIYLDTPISGKDGDMGTIGDNISSGKEPLELLIEKERKEERREAIEKLFSNYEHLLFIAIAKYFEVQYQKLIEEGESVFASLLPEVFKLRFLEKKTDQEVVNDLLEKVKNARDKVRLFASPKKFINVIFNFLVIHVIIPKIESKKMGFRNTDELLDLTMQIEESLNKLVTEPKKYGELIKETINSNPKKSQDFSLSLYKHCFDDATKQSNTGKNKRSNPSIFYKIVDNYLQQIEITINWLKLLFGEYLTPVELMKLTLSLSAIYGNYLTVTHWGQLDFWLRAIIKFNEPLFMVFAFSILDLGEKLEKLANLEEI